MIRAAAAVLAVVALGLYLWFQWGHFFHFWRKSTSTPSDFVLNTAVTLGGFVGGGVAGFFGQTLPPPSGASHLSLRQRVTQKFAVVLKSWIGFAYFLAYIATGIAALMIAVRDPASSPDLVHEQIKNIALVFVGLVIAIVAAWFK